MHVHPWSAFCPGCGFGLPAQFVFPQAADPRCMSRLRAAACAPRCGVLAPPCRQALLPGVRRVVAGDGRRRGPCRGPAVGGGAPRVGRAGPRHAGRPPDRRPDWAAGRCLDHRARHAGVPACPVLPRAGSSPTRSSWRTSSRTSSPDPVAGKLRVVCGFCDWPGTRPASERPARQERDPLPLRHEPARSRLQRPRRHPGAHRPSSSRR